ncbi:hypothetical protein [Sandaracinus amylolyticus]|nr:hypothetical protein [Sandaracinus amylolyticus]
MTRSLFVLAACFALAALPGCGDDDGGDPGGGSDAGPGGGGMDATTADDAGDTPGADAQLPDGATSFTQCTNGVDDDGDGEIDGLDRECTGPTDNDEGTFGTGIPGDNRDPDCQDCFFDGNSGSGNDGCRYATTCLTDGTPTSGSGSCATCEASTQCLEGGCLEATPNGCDCFGCCEVHVDADTTVNILLGGACSLENIDDETACPRCMPDTECANDCGRCELCLGRTIEDLPADCFPDGGPPIWQCDGDQVPCPEGTCAPGYYCQLGCCLSELI